MISFKEYFLLEGMKTPSELKQEQIYFIINKQDEKHIQISMYKRPQKFMFAGQLMKYKNLWVFHIQTKINDLGNVYAHKGYGPVMYDIAMELASKNGEGLTPSINIAGNTSEEAQNVYKYYYNNRSDVQKTPLDSETLNARYDEYDYDDLNLSEQPWITTVYSKSNLTTLNQLESNNMIRYINQKEPISSPLDGTFLSRGNPEKNNIEKRQNNVNYLISQFKRIYGLTQANAEKLYRDLYIQKMIRLNNQGIPNLIPPLIPHDVDKHIDISKYK